MEENPPRKLVPFHFLWPRQDQPTSCRGILLLYAHTSASFPSLSHFLLGLLP